MDFDFVVWFELLEWDEYVVFLVGWYWWVFGLGKLVDVGKFDEIMCCINGFVMEGVEVCCVCWVVVK